MSFSFLLVWKFHFIISLLFINLYLMFIPSLHALILSFSFLPFLSFLYLLNHRPLSFYFLLSLISPLTFNIFPFLALIWNISYTYLWLLHFFPTAAGQHKLLQHVFRRHLKPKKQHEVARLALVAAQVAHSVCDGVMVDVGSGQGHLSRLLAYGHNVKVVCLEAEDKFIDGAR